MDDPIRPVMLVPIPHYTRWLLRKWDKQVPADATVAAGVDLGLGPLGPRP